MEWRPCQSREGCATVEGEGRLAKTAIRDLLPSERGWAAAAVSRAWGSPAVVSRGRRWEADRLPGLVAERDGSPVGLLTYRLEAGEMEVVTLQAFEPRAGIGSALLGAARRVAARAGCKRLWLVTTNDNLPAQSFYQAAGMRLVATHRGALVESRQLKPEIPLVGLGGVPLEDELEYEWSLQDASRP